MKEQKLPKFEAKNFKDLEKFVKICAKLNISEIKVGDTHIIFGEVSQQPRKPRKAAIREQQQSEIKANLQEQADFVRDEIDTAHIEDPLAYEESLVAGLLTNEDTISKEDRRAESTL